MSEYCSLIRLGKLISEMEILSDYTISYFGEGDTLGM